MRLGTIAFLLGILLLQQLVAVPDSYWAWFLCLSLPLSFLVKKPFNLVFWLLSGFLYGLVHAHYALYPELNANYEGNDVWIEGVIASVPKDLSGGVRFEFDVDLNDSAVTGLPDKLRLSWYRSDVVIKAGERWRLKVKLKRAYGFMNPGGFDYEAWLFAQGIRATGYVRQDSENKRLSSPAGLFAQLLSVRASHAAYVMDQRPALEFGGMLAALSVGVRHDIADEHWQVLLKTGTNHLMAISGLHVGLVAGFGFFLIQWFWRRFEVLCLYMPAQKAGAIAAIVVAAIYALLAGFSVPTQRAFIMVAVAMLGLLLQRNFAHTQLLAMALLVVLVVDPLAVMVPGFWLSFIAVMIILYCGSGRVGEASIWSRWGKIHTVLGLALLPMTFLFFQQGSLIAPLANLVAVPWVSFVVVPLTLLGAGLAGIAPWLGHLILSVADVTLGCIWPFLVFLSELPGGHVRVGIHELVLFVAATIGLCWLLAPKGVPARWLGLIWLGGLFFIPQQRPAYGEYWFTLLDVGQGLAAVVETQNSVLVFDAGPKYSQSFNAGEAVLLPFLASRGISQVDLMMISHGDNDHLGGANSVYEGIAVKRVVTSVPDLIAWTQAESCLRGQSWRWEGVLFEVLHPPAQFSGIENDGSCVIKVSTSIGVLLLTGDIEARAEQGLIAHYSSSELKADVLVAPHHGSKTSSTERFVAVVQPNYVLFAVGYRNRWGFPANEVAARYEELGAQLYESHTSGAISFKFTASGLSEPYQYRIEKARYWHHLAQ